MPAAFANFQKAIDPVVWLLVIGLCGLAYMFDFFLRSPRGAFVWPLQVLFGLPLLGLIVVPAGLRLTRNARSELNSQCATSAATISAEDTQCGGTRTFFGSRHMASG